MLFSTVGLPLPLCIAQSEREKKKKLINLNFPDFSIFRISSNLPGYMDYVLEGCSFNPFTPNK